MKLFEYQAKKLFAEYQIPVPKGTVIEDFSEVSNALRELVHCPGNNVGLFRSADSLATKSKNAGELVDSPSFCDAVDELSPQERTRQYCRDTVLGGKCVLKSQVLTGGRGKAGLIRFADSVEQAQTEAKQLFQGRKNDATARIPKNMAKASPNTPKSEEQKGLDAGVKKILIEEVLEIDKEIYLSITIEPVEAKIMIMASNQGGVDIENLATKSPEKIIKEKINDSQLLPFQVRNILFELGIKGDCFKQCFGIINRLFELFVERDVELAEINPLVITKSGQVVAADGKIILDDNASFRQKSFSLTREHFDSDVEFEAAQKGIPYLLFDGDIGLMCAGAGLTNTVYDLINDYGGTVANYLEFGGPNYKRAVEAMELTLKSNPKVILIVTFGTIARADVMANGIVEAIEKLKPRIPVITAIRGTGEKEAWEILKGIGLEPLFDTEEAVQRAVELT